MSLDANHQLLSHGFQRRFQARQLGTVMWVEEPTDLFFIRIEALCQFGVANTGFLHRHVERGLDGPLCRDRHQCLAGLALAGMGDGIPSIHTTGDGFFPGIRGGIRAITYLTIRPG